MSTICTRCALRLQRAAQIDTQHVSKRAFSQSTTRSKHHGVPQFQPTPSPELDAVLTSMHDKHFIPAYLHKTERKLIFGTKHRQSLLDNPQTVAIGDDEVPLQWIDRTKEIPNRLKLLNEAIDHMAASEGGKGWYNLPSLLQGLRKVRRDMLDGPMAGKIVRKALASNRFGIILQCLQQVERTGLTLQHDEVLEKVIWGLHDIAQKDGWSEAATAKALKDAKEVGVMLETEGHGATRSIGPNDARTRPEVVGVFLELAAVYAYKFRGGKDVDGQVKAYTERLLSCIGEQAQPLSHAPAPKGPQYEMLHGVPIWHGLRLAEEILGKDMPNPQQAQKIRRDYEAGLTILAQAIEAQGPTEGSYGEQALKAWRGCIRE